VHGARRDRKGGPHVRSGHTRGCRFAFTWEVVNRSDDSKTLAKDPSRNWIVLTRDQPELIRNVIVTYTYLSAQDSLLRDWDNFVHRPSLEPNQSGVCGNRENHAGQFFWPCMSWEHTSCKSLSVSSHSCKGGPGPDAIVPDDSSFPGIPVSDLRDFRYCYFGGL
jgi:hypothetical protein